MDANRVAITEPLVEVVPPLPPADSPVLAISFTDQTILGIEGAMMFLAIRVKASECTLTDVEAPASGHAGSSNG